MPKACGRQPIPSGSHTPRGPGSIPHHSLACGASTPAGVKSLWGHGWNPTAPKASHSSSSSCPSQGAGYRCLLQGWQPSQRSLLPPPAGPGAPTSRGAPCSPSPLTAPGTGGRRGGERRVRPAAGREPQPDLPRRRARVT